MDRAGAGVCRGGGPGLQRHEPACAGEPGGLRFLVHDSSLAFTNARGRVAEVTNVQVAGTWDVWTGRYELAESGRISGGWMCGR